MTKQHRFLVKKAAKITSVLLTLFLVLLFAAFGLLRVSGMNYHVVVSESMFPYLKVYDLVIVADKDVNNIETSYNVGDIVVYNAKWAGGEKIVHRIVDEQDGHYIIKGDNNPVADPEEVSFEQIDGRLAGRVHLVGLFGKPEFLYPTIILIFMLYFVQWRLDGEQEGHSRPTSDCRTVPRGRKGRHRG